MLISMLPLQGFAAEPPQIITRGQWLSVLVNTFGYSPDPQFTAEAGTTYHYKGKAIHGNQEAHSSLSSAKSITAK